MSLSKKLEDVMAILPNEISFVSFKQKRVLWSGIERLPKKPATTTTFRLLARAIACSVKRPLVKEDLNVIQYQFQKANNIFIISDGISVGNEAPLSRG